MMKTILCLMAVDEMTRWMLVVRCAFSRILLPDPALKPMLALK